MADKKYNVQNLQPVQTKSEARRRGRNGGIKSGEVRRERKKARECMEMILSLNTKSQKQKDLMTNLGIADEEQKNIMSLMASMYARAVTTGDPSAVRSVLEIAGEMEAKQTVDEKPTININIAAATIDDVEVE